MKSNDRRRSEVEALEVKPIRLTKRLDELLMRYSVKQRNRPWAAMNIRTQRRFQLPPLHFAVWEAHLNAAFHIWKESGPEYFEYMVHISSIANGSNIGLKDANCSLQQATDDYRHTVKVLTDAGLYFELLD